MGSYFDYLTIEDRFHRAVYEYLSAQYSKVAMFWHTPNEGRRTKFESWKAKYLGITPGVPDWIIIVNARVLFLELKIKPNVLTKYQKAFLTNVNTLGFVSAVAFDFDEAKLIIDNFIKEGTK